MQDRDYWNVTPKEAVAVQERLRDRVSLEDNFGRIETVAGADVAIGRGWKEAKCAVVVLSFPGLEVVEARTHTAEVTFPYVPGLLAFRELPIFLQTYEMLHLKPDLLFFDGHGCAHPRRFGLACFAGILLDKPAVGCAKSKLIGNYDQPPVESGSVSVLVTNDGDRVGDVVRTKTGVKPVFISPGHRISFESATQFALRCTRGYRIPEPTRQAHILVSRPTSFHC